MALSKLAIFSLVGIGTVATVGAVTTGVVVSQQKAEKIDEETNLEPNNKPNENSDLTNNKTPIDLDAILKTIKPSDIVVYKLEQKSTTQIVNRKSFVNTNETIPTSSIYPFNVLKDQLGINKQNINIPNTVSIELSLDDEKNTLAILNDGKLAITIKAKETSNKDNEKTLNLVVDTFKKPNEKIKKLLAETKDQFVLSILSDKDSNPKKFTTLQYLNKENEDALTEAEQRSNLASIQTKKVSGLNTLLSEVKKTEIGDATVIIEGKVKLEKIKKEQDKTYFYLSSINKTPLKLLRKEKDKNEISEMLIEQIKLNNLAISSISIVPVGNSLEKSVALVDELKKTWKDDNNPAETLTVTIPINKTPSNETVVLPINAYALEKTNEATTFKASLLVTFGSGSFAKTYDTNNDVDLMELKEAEFGFGIYSKDLGEKKTDIKQSKAGETSNMLNTYFTTTSNKQPTNKPMQQQNPMKQTGEFNLNRLMKNNLSKTFDVGLIQKEDKSKQMLRSMPEVSSQKQPSKSQNILAFANYSYPGMENEKVLFAPSLSLINIEIKTTDASK